jgi:hypothetical protein
LRHHEGDVKEECAHGSIYAGGFQEVPELLLQLVQGIAEKESGSFATLIG